MSLKANKLHKALSLSEHHTSAQYLMLKWVDDKQYETLIYVLLNKYLLSNYCIEHHQYSEFRKS